MNILAIDTSTKNASVSLKTNGDIYSENIQNEITHSEKLLPLIHSILEKSSTNISDIDMFMTTIGPGSFTGVRIGLATIKALAHVKKVPIYQVSTLDLVSYITFLNMDKTNILSSDSPSKIYIVPLLDAKNERVYYSVYEYTINIDMTFEKKELHIPSNLPILTALEEISTTLNNTKNLTSDSKIIILGDGLVSNYDNVYEFFKNTSLNTSNKIPLNHIIFSDKVFAPDSKYLFGHYEENLLKEDYMKDYISLDALYARISQAERKNENE